LNIFIIAGTRPEAIKLVPVYLEAKKRGIEVKFISTGQHREMLDQVFSWFDIQPYKDLEIMQKNQTLGILTSNALLKLDSLFAAEKPDCVMVQGDTTTAFVASLAAYYHKIKVAHVEAGLRTHNKYSPWPEEINRSLIGRIADLHFAPTYKSADNLKRENISENKIIITGNTVIDALLYTNEKAKKENIFPVLLRNYFNGNEQNRKLVLITGHRRENWGQGFEEICKAIHSLAVRYPDIHFIYPVHLNPNVQAPVQRLLSGQKNVILTDPLNYPEFVRMMERSYIILTDSGGVQEEAPSLGKPVLVMRNTTERPEGVDAGSVKVVGTSSVNIINAFIELIENEYAYKSMSDIKNPYGDGTASSQIIDSLIKDHNEYGK
jgi:UDP-N-acetylglucosamine 2-epimerase (non-hydrolysing)